MFHNSEIGSSTQKSKPFRVYEKPNISSSTKPQLCHCAVHSSVVHAENNETNCHAAERRRFFTGAAAAEKIDRRAAAAGQNDPARRRRNCVVGAGLCFIVDKICNNGSQTLFTPACVGPLSVHLASTRLRVMVIYLLRNQLLTNKRILIDLCIKSV